jgi:hypothetical protein
MTIKINTRLCIAGIAAALALFAAGCDNSILESGQDRDQKALALITLSGAAAPSASARTIIPGAVSFYYTLEFKAGESVITAAISDGSVTKQVELAPGTWNVTARGYENAADASDPANAVVTGSATITAIAGTLVEATVTLNAVVNETGEGEVFYDIRFPESVETAALTLSPTGVGSVQKKDLIGSGANTGYLSAPSGYYRLTIDLSYYDSGESTIRQAKKSAVIHLYDGLTTEISETFAAADFAEIPSFDTVEALSSYLAAQPQNTAETPYQAALRVALTDLAEGADSLGKLFNAFNGRYVAVDLRGCTGDTIAAISTSATLATPIINTRVHRSRLTSLVLPATLKTLGSYTLYGSLSLADVEWPAAAEEASIGQDAFGNCGLRRVTLPDTLKTIGGSAFVGAPLPSIDLSATALTEIPMSLFQNNTTLISVKLPDTITTIISSAFDGCRSLKEVNLPVFIESIGNNAFRNCQSLGGDLQFPASLQTLGTNAFAGCSFTSIDLTGSQITSIVSVFSDCSSLVLVKIPASSPLEVMSAGNFAACLSPNFVFEITGDATENGFRLSEDGKLLIKGTSIITASPVIWGAITIPEEITKINDNAFASSRITSVNLPSRLITVGSGAFLSCASLGSVTIPEPVTTIGNFAFQNCSSLVFADLPATVTDIGSSAFASTILDTIIVRAATPPTLVEGRNVIPSSRTNLKVYVPDNSVTTYTDVATGGLWASTALIKNKIVALSALPAAGD